MTMPTLTRARAATATSGLTTLVSPSRTAESRTPKTGFMKPKTATRETGLAASVTDHREYAAAEMKAR